MHHYAPAKIQLIHTVKFRCRTVSKNCYKTKIKKSYQYANLFPMFFLNMVITSSSFFFHCREILVLLLPHNYFIVFFTLHFLLYLIIPTYLDSFAYIAFNQVMSTTWQLFFKNLFLIAATWTQMLQWLLFP